MPFWKTNWKITKITFAVCTLLLKGFTTLFIYSFLWKFKPKPHYKTFWGSVGSFVLTALLVLVVLLVSSWVVTSDFISSLNFLHLTTSNDVNVFLTLLVYALTLAVLIQTLDSQRASAERTARMEMAKVLTEAFSHSEMFEAIEYFLQVSPYLVDKNGKGRQVYIEEINEKPETKKYRYRILTTLHHAERLYKTEKADTALFTSLITPDIVEVALCLYQLDDYMKDVDKPVYEMVYRVFEDIRTSYLAPYAKAVQNKKEINSKKLQHIRRILCSLQKWDKEWGDEGDIILTDVDLIMVYLIDEKYSLVAYKNISNELNLLDKRFEALAKDSKSTKPFKRFADLYFLRADGKCEQKDYKGAIQDYTKSIELNPKNIYTYSNRGINQVRLGNYLEAIKDFDKAIILDPKFIGGYCNRGIAKYNLAQYEEAIDDYNQAIELNPEDDDAYYLRGLAKDDLEKYEEAVVDYTKAIDLDPQHADAYNNRALTYQQMAQQARAKGNHTEGKDLESKAQADFAQAKRLESEKQ